MKEKNKVFIHFLVDSKIKDELKKEADEYQMSLNAYIRFVLLQRKKN